MNKKNKKSPVVKKVTTVEPKSYNRAYTILPNGVIALSIKDAQDYIANNKSKPYEG